MSDLDTYDYICLVASYNDVSDGSKNRISPELEARGYTPEQLQQATKHKSDKFNPIKSCGLRFTRPFDHLKFEPFGYVLTLFENYERGCLPFPGAVVEQPAQIMEIFSVLRQLKHEAELKLIESTKQNGRNKHQNKPGASR